MGFNDHFGVRNEDLFSFINHSKAYASNQALILNRCLAHSNRAKSETGFEPSENSVDNLFRLELSSTKANQFVTFVHRRLELGVWSETHTELTTPIHPTTLLPQFPHNANKWWENLRPCLIGVWTPCATFPTSLLELYKPRLERRLLSHGRLWPPHQARANGADRGGGLSWEYRGRFEGETSVASRFESGHSIIRQSLTDIADNGTIASDEFEAIMHQNGNVTLVLPGVIDLSNPQLGYDRLSRSSRDLDQVAIRSAFSSEIAGNSYAIMVASFVANAIKSGLIQRGADVLIVGHSFGADTALDLAASRQFNGGMVNVTHVVATGYHNEPQLDDVAGSTQVAVLQNIYDVPVLVEGIAFDFAPWRWAGRPGSRGAGLRGMGRVAGEVVEHGLRRASGDEKISLAGDRVEELDGRGLLIEFEGGLNHFGHHPNHYIDYLERSGHDPSVATLVSEIGAQGYGHPGPVLAVDVSLPESGNGSDSS